MKKGQSALEFLMTYGWAILVVLIAIGALAYFGVLNPARFLPSSCIIFPGVSCTNFKVAAGTAEFVVQNGMGETLNSFNVTISNPSTSSTCVGGGSLVLATSGTGTTLTDGETELVSITCTTGTLGTIGERFKSDLNVSYSVGSGSNIIYHTKRGSIVSTIE